MVAGTPGRKLSSQSWIVEVIEKYVRVPLLIRTERGVIHRKLKMTDGSVKYAVRFGRQTVWVYPKPSGGLLLEAWCVERADACKNKLYEAAALRIVMRDIY